MPKKSAKRKIMKAAVSDPMNASFFDDIRRILCESRRQAYAAVNAVMVEAYWKIGRRTSRKSRQEVTGPSTERA